MKRALMALAATVLFCAPVFTAPRAGGDTVAEDRQKAIERAHKAAVIFNEIMAAPDSAIPDKLLADAETIAIFPDVTKGAFIFGGTGGSGIVSIRNAKTGRWGQPLFIKIGGGSWGAQIGVEQSDFILVGVNRASERLFEKGTWKVDVDAGATAGPVGRKAQAATDWKGKSEFLSYSRSKGLFAGISLGGAKINLDKDQNEAVYGAGVSPTAILDGTARMTEDSAGVNEFPAALAKYGPARPDRK